MSGCIVRPWEVSVSGFAPLIYVAKSRGQALSKAWGDYQILGETSFHNFLQIARAKRSELAGFGAQITVAGAPAFRVGERGQYVAFVRPGSDVVLLSHPADVQEAA